ncbi:caspase-1-like [Microplitis mediator]|uniref:caspase-1-like n=1 Tax=Microplitis mediator TaxID=375433 RepID=UPI002552855F|nr:caspase-1-like [Microplitis mediator]XP_057336116.1 caspase-1-like [Microplitis mediator]
MNGIEMDSGDIIDSNKFNNIKDKINDENNDVGDAFGYGKNSVSPYPTSLQTAPTEKYASHYNMSHAKRGFAIIFNHETFNVSHLKARTGTNVDCENLVSTLKLLQFDVFHYHNLNHRDILKQLETVANTDHTQHDCLLVAVLSHGELGVLYAHDTAYKAETIWSYFTSDKCPTLSGKPKLFFIQACQGDKLDGGVAVKERTETDGQPTATFRIPTHADFLIAYSTIPGFYSWRNTTRGSWFMQALCIELRENGTRYDILTLLTFVSQRVALDFESNTPDNMTMHQQKQIPCITSMLTRLLKFTPAKNADSNPTGSS